MQCVIQNVQSSCQWEFSKVAETTKAKADAPQTFLAALATLDSTSPIKSVERGSQSSLAASVAYSNFCCPAAVYLFEHAWRARFCAECNKRFVAAEPKNKFCGGTCSNKAHNRQRLKSWHAHKHEWRPTRKNETRRKAGRK